MNDLYNVVDSNTGEVVAQYDDKFAAQMKSYEMNNKDNGYKYVVELVYLRGE